MSTEIIEFTDIDISNLTKVKKLLKTIQELRSKKDNFFSPTFFVIWTLKKKLKELDREYFFSRANNVAVRLNILRITKKEKYFFQTFVWLVEYQERIRGSEYPQEFYNQLKTSEELFERIMVTTISE